MNDDNSGFEFLDHPADVWVKAWGSNISEAFSQCVYGLMKTMLDGWPDKIEIKQTKEIIIQDIDRESLLVGFLSEFLYLFDVEELVIKSITSININEKDGGEWILKAVAEGEKFDHNRHIPDTEVKAITYSYIEINEEKGRTEIKIIYDI